MMATMSTSSHYGEFSLVSRDLLYMRECFVSAQEQSYSMYEMIEMELVG